MRPPTLPHIWSSLICIKHWCNMSCHVSPSSCSTLQPRKLTWQGLTQVAIWVFWLNFGVWSSEISIDLHQSLIHHVLSSISWVLLNLPTKKTHMAGANSGGHVSLLNLVEFWKFDPWGSALICIKHWSTMSCQVSPGSCWTFQENSYGRG